MTRASPSTCRRVAHTLTGRERPPTSAASNGSQAAARPSPTLVLAPVSTGHSHAAASSSASLTKRADPARSAGMRACRGPSSSSRATASASRTATLDAPPAPAPVPAPAPAPRDPTHPSNSSADQCTAGALPVEATQALSRAGPAAERPTLPPDPRAASLALADAFHVVAAVAASSTSRPPPRAEPPPPSPPAQTRSSASGRATSIGASGSLDATAARSRRRAAGRGADVPETAPSISCRSPRPALPATILLAEAGKFPR